MAMVDITILPVEEKAAIEARRAYQREWRAKNHDKVKATEARFWAKKAAMAAAANENNTAE